MSESRRRGLMGTQGEAPFVPAKLTPGEYTRGTSQWAVDENGKVTITNWATSSQYALILPLDKAISIKPGDEIAFYLLRKSGSPNWHGTDVHLYKSATSNLLLIGSNMTWNWSNNTNTATKASTVTGEVTHIYINNRGNKVESAANYSFALRMTVNGKVVLE